MRHREVTSSDVKGAFEAEPGVLWLGSFVSIQHPANLSSVGDFLQKLWQGLAERTPVRIPPEDLSRAWGRVKDVAFEAFLEIVESNKPGSLKQLLRSYAVGQPNGNHKAVASLLDCEHIHTVVTTNFDDLIERACDEQEVRYVVERPNLGRDPYTSGSSSDDHVQPRSILKPHGSVRDLETHAEELRATVRRVGRGFAPADEETLRQVLRSPVLFAGYSGRDLDLSPIIIASSHHNHFWLLRPKSNVQAYPVLVRARSPRIVRGDLNESGDANPLAWLAREWAGIEVNVEKNTKPDWDAVNSWLDSLTGVEACLMLGDVLAYVKGRELELARDQIGGALRLGTPNPDQVRLKLADTYAYQGQYSEALSLYEQTLPDLRAPEAKARAHKQIAFCHKQRRRFRRAEAGLARAREMFNGWHPEPGTPAYDTLLYVRRDIASLTLARSRLPLPWAYLSAPRRIRETLVELDALVAEAADVGDLDSKANALRLRGRARFYLGIEPERALEDLDEAESTFKTLGDAEGWYSCARAKGVMLLYLGQIGNAYSVIEPTYDRARGLVGKRESDYALASVNRLEQRKLGRLVYILRVAPVASLLGKVLRYRVFRSLMT